MRGEGRSSAEAGFTLVEVLVAFAILAGALGTALSAFGAGPRAADRAAALRMATLVAESALARVGADIPLAPGAAEGREGTVGWRVAVDPWAPDGEGRAPAPLPLYRVSVTVSWEGGGPLALVTLRPGLREAAP